jgi:hypothetical protein
MKFTWMNAGLSEIQFTKSLAENEQAIQDLLIAINCDLEFNRVEAEEMVSSGRVDIVLFYDDEPVFCIECQDSNGKLDRTHSTKILPYMASTGARNGCVLAYSFPEYARTMYVDMAGKYNIAAVTPIYVNGEIDWNVYYTPFTGSLYDDASTSNTKHSQKLEGYRENLIAKLDPVFNANWSMKTSYFRKRDKTGRAFDHLFVHPSLTLTKIDIYPDMVGVSTDELSTKIEAVKQIFAKYDLKTCDVATEKNEPCIKVQIHNTKGKEDWKHVGEILKTIDEANFKE